jgi:hypothetical protein
MPFFCPHAPKMPRGEAKGNTVYISGRRIAIKSQLYLPAKIFKQKSFFPQKSFPTGKEIILIEIEMATLFQMQ